MARSAAEERAGQNSFLQWRSGKKQFMLSYAEGREARAKSQLKELMLLVNCNFEKMQRDRKHIEMRDLHRE